MVRRRRVLIVEDEGFARDSLEDLLSKLPDLEVVATVGTLREARTLLEELMPDVLVADLFLEDGNSMELLRMIRDRRFGTRVIVLTGAKDVFAAAEARAAGAMGYVLKAQPVRELVEAVRSVVAGRAYVSPLISDRLGSQPVDASDRVGLAKLSRRELEVLRFLVAGHTSSEIAGRLCVSPKTIDTHRSNMYRKLSLRNAVELLRFAHAHGIGLPMGNAEGAPSAAAAVRRRLVAGNGLESVGGVAAPSPAAPSPAAASTAAAYTAEAYTRR